MDNKKTIIFEVVAITLITFFVYFPSLTNGFIWDEARVHFREIPKAGYRLPGHIEEFMKSTDP